MIAASCSAKIAKAATAQAIPVSTAPLGAADRPRLSGLAPSDMGLGLHIEVRFGHLMPQAARPTNAAAATGLRPRCMGENRVFPIGYLQALQRSEAAERQEIT
ncbi:hypothetical protein DLREEDagr8_12600 [Dongia sp. agr-C8]